MAKLVQVVPVLQKIHIITTDKDPSADAGRVYAERVAAFGLYDDGETRLLFIHGEDASLSDLPDGDVVLDVHYGDLGYDWHKKYKK